MGRVLGPPSCVRVRHRDYPNRTPRRHRARPWPGPDTRPFMDARRLLALCPLAMAVLVAHVLRRGAYLIEANRWEQASDDTACWFRAFEPREYPF